MKFTATKDNLMMGISTVQKAIASKNTIPVLTGIYLKAEHGHLVFAATDLEIGIECKIPVQVIEEGHTVIPAHFLVEMVRKLPNTNLIFEYMEDTASVKIIYDHAETMIKCWPGEEFPVIPNPEEEHSFNIAPAVFKNLVKQASFCANIGESRPIFTGALMEINGNHLNLISTDSHRLAFKTCIIQNLSGNDFKMVVPVKSLNEISRIIKEDGEESLNIRCNGNQICFEIQNIRMISRLIDGIFPNYRQVIPENYELLIKAKKKQILESAERASLFVAERDGSSVLKFDINDSNMNISSKSEYGMVNENIQIYTEGDSLSILFNAKYLIDAFKIMDFDDMTVEMGGPLSPAVFRPLNDDSFLYLLLPLRG